MEGASYLYSEGTTMADIFGSVWSAVKRQFAGISLGL